MTESRLILFDAGNTLVWVDHAYLIELLRGLGIETMEAELLQAENAAKLMLDELLRSGAGGNDGSRGRLYFSRVFEELNVPRALFPRLAERLEARHAEGALWRRVLPGTSEALAELRARGHRLGVISNSDGRVATLLESVGLAGHFDFILDSALVGIEKPDPRIFLLGCERGGVQPEEALYVGDLYEIDVVGARAAGLRAVLIDPLGLRTDLDCERIAGVHELPARLAESAIGMR